MKNDYLHNGRRSLQFTSLSVRNKSGLEESGVNLQYKMCSNNSKF